MNKPDSVAALQAWVDAQRSADGWVRMQRHQARVMLAAREIQLQRRRQAINAVLSHFTIGAIGFGLGVAFITLISR